MHNSTSRKNLKQGTLRAERFRGKGKQRFLFCFVFCNSMNADTSASNAVLHHSSRQWVRGTLDQAKSNQNQFQKPFKVGESSSKGHYTLPGALGH